MNYLLLLDRIDKINKLYEEDNQIHYWTARGTVSGENWLPKTKDQLDSWGCKYTEVKVCKPIYDLFIDDKNINSDKYFKN